MDSETAAKASKDNSPHPMFNVAENRSISRKNSNDDAEISIFEAHKYFSEESNEPKLPSHDHLLPLPRLPSSLPRVDSNGSNFITKSSSEASCNSRNPLLSTRNRARKRWSATKKWLLRRNCCCSCENSVITNEDGGPVKKSDTINQTTSTFPKCSISDNIVEIHHIKAMAPIAATASSSMEGPRQQRITARGRPFIDGAVGFTFPILNSSFMEAFPPHPPPIGRPQSTENQAVDDGGSDASSDLFEIESFCTGWWDSLDEERKSPASPPQCDCKVSGGVAGDGEGAAAELSISLSEVSIATVWPLREEEGDGEGKTNGNGSVVMRCEEEKKAAAVKCMAEGSPAVPLHVGGSPPCRSNHAPPLPVAFAA